MARENQSDAAIPSTGAAAVPYPTWREVARGLLKNGAEMFFGGPFDGTGSAIVVSDLPFDPACVVLINRDGLAWAVKTPGMAGDDCVKFVTDGTMSYITSDGITLGTKSFTIGTDGDLNVDTEELHYIAVGARDTGGSV